MKIIMSGATGFIGTAILMDFVRKGHEVLALVQKKTDLPCKSVEFPSGKNAVEELSKIISNADAILHLAGSPIAAGRWSRDEKKRIYDSRISTTKIFVEALKKIPTKDRPQTLVNASAIGIYGDRADEVLTENSLHGEGFLAEVTKDWEAEAQKAEDLGLRVVKIRSGIVLGRNGGVLQKMQPVVLGSGKQWMSWIHLKDEIRFIEFALTNKKMRGAYNAVSPNPEQNITFTRKFARARGIPLVVQAPAFMMKLVMGEMSSLVLYSQRVMPVNALNEGFTFLYPKLDDALDEIYPTRSLADERYDASQFIAKPVSEVFSFFSRAENLEKLTPPWLGFHIVHQSTKEIQEKTLIDYKLKIHGLPVRWQSRIENWILDKEFVDTQVKGPYAKWYHVHQFEKVPNGTLIHDHIDYRVPGGLLGKVFLGSFIRKDVENIFSYRKKKIAEEFKV